MSIQLTVALCAYNPRPDLIARAVDSVVSQLAEFGESAEFVIIDNNSDPPLSQAAYLAGSPVEIIREPIQGLTAAREAAIRRARGRVILFLDDDNILAPGYLSAVVNAFADPTLGVLGGGIVPEYESQPPGWLKAFEAHLAVRRHRRDLIVETTALPYTDYFPIGAGFSVLRAIATEYLADAQANGRIEGRKGLHLSSCEDLDLDLYALFRGYRLKILGALSLTHVIPARRCTESYISALVVSIVRSCHEIERKWAPRFQKPIFPAVYGSRLGAGMRALTFLLLSPLSARHRVKRRMWEEFYRLRTY